jgi:hypothetical protein
MPSITKLRINGRETLAEPSLVMPRGFILSWEYDEAFSGYEIRVGSSAVGWSTDSFAGDIASVSSGSTPSVEEKLSFAFGLPRGRTYFGQIRLNTGEWRQFSIRIKDAVFVVDAKYFTDPPLDDISHLSINSNVNIAVETSSAVAFFSTEWFNNGVVVPTLSDSLILPSSYLRFGDEWYVRVTPYDDMESGSTFTMPVIKVGNIVTASADVSILPANPTPDDILVASYDAQSFSTVDPSALRFGHRWFVNGQQVLPPIDSPDDKIYERWARLRLQPGDQIGVQVQPFIAGIPGEPIASPLIRIGGVARSRQPILVDGNSDGEKASSLSPTISWKSYRPLPNSNSDQKVRVMVGKRPRDGSILDKYVLEADGVFQVPDNMLYEGLTYYVTLFDEDSDIYESVAFSTPGHAWRSNVGNDNGWILEFLLSCRMVDPQGSTVLYPYAIECSDGKYAVTLDVSPLSVRARCGSRVLFSSQYDFSYQRKLQIGVVGTRIVISIDGNSIFDSDFGDYALSTVEKNVQIVPRVRESVNYEMEVSAVFLSTTFYPSQGASPVLEGRLPLVKVGSLSQDSGGFSVVGKEGGSDSDSIFYVDTTRSGRYYDCSPIKSERFGVYRMSADGNRYFSIVGHPAGATIISGCEPDKWSLIAGTATSQDLSNSGFSTVSSHGSAPFRFNTSGLTIDTGFINLGTQDLGSQSGSVSVVKLEAKLGISLYKFAVSGTVLSAQIEEDFADSFLGQFSISLSEISLATLVQRLSSMNIGISGSAVPLSSYYTVILTTGFESVPAEGIKPFAPTSSYPLAFEIESESLSVGVSPMGSVSGRKAFIETSRGSNTWSQSDLYSDGYTVDFSFSVDSIEESLAPDALDEGGIGLSLFDGMVKHNFNVESGTALFDNVPVMPVELGQSVDCRLVKHGDVAQLFCRAGGSSSSWLSPVNSVGISESFVSGSCYAPRAATSSDGKHMLAVWWSDDGGLAPRCWMSHWNIVDGWSNPVQLGRQNSFKNPSVAFDRVSNLFHVVMQGIDGSSNSISHLTVRLSMGLPSVSAVSRVSFITQVDSYTTCTCDDDGNLHAFWTDSKASTSEVYHAFFSSGSGWSNPVVVTSTEAGAASPCCIFSAGFIFMAFVNRYSGGRSSICMSRYQIGRGSWESSGFGLTDIQVSSGALSFSAQNPSIAATTAGVVHVVWDDYSVGVSGTSASANTAGRNRVIMYRSYSPTLVSVGNVGMIADSSSGDCSNPSIMCPPDRACVVVGYLRRSKPATSNLSGTSFEQLGDIPTVYMAYRNISSVGTGGWTTPARHKAIVPTSAREFYDFSMINSSESYAHVFYGFTPLSKKDRIQKEFANLRTIGYARVGVDFAEFSEPFISLGSSLESVDDAQLASAREPYIRFGDMSSFRSCRIRLEKLKACAGSACTPREITSIGSVNGNLPNKIPTDVKIGSSGDAFVISEGSVFHYDWQADRIFNMSSESARSITYLPDPSDGIVSCTFDLDGNMIAVSSSGQVYVSTDLLRFVRFDFGMPVNQVLRYDKGVAFVTDIMCYYIRNWREYISQVPTRHRDNLVTIASDDLVELANLNGMSIYNSSYFGLLAWGVGGVFSLSESYLNPLGRSSDFSAQAIVSIADGPDANLYCATGSRIYRLDGSRWTPLRVVGSLGGPVVLGSITSLSALGNRLLVGCSRGVFECSVYGSEAEGSIIPNSAIYLPGQSGTTSTSAYSFRMPVGLDISEDVVKQVVINGHAVNVGFGISNSEFNGERVVRFACPLLPEDSVGISIRDDMRLIRRLKPNPAEVLATGSFKKNILATTDGGKSFFAHSQSVESSVVKITSSSGMPSDEVILDTIPPRGKLTFEKALSANRVRLSVQPPANPDGGASLPFDATSGIDSYIISNYSNFTSNGIDPLEPVPFSSQFDHSLLSLSSFSNRIYQETTADLSCLLTYSPTGGANKTDFLFRSFPASVIRRVGDNFADSPVILADDADAAMVRDAIVFQNRMYVAVARDSSANVEIVSSADGSQWTSVFLLDASNFSKFFISSYDNKLYMLTSGPARIYSFDGFGSPVLRIGFLGDHGTGLTGYDRFIYAALGRDGKIMRLDLGSSPVIVETVHVDSSELTSAGRMGTNIYVGTKSSGRILRSPDEDEPFLDSWRSTPSSIPYIASLNIEGLDFVVAAIGNRIFRYSNGWSLLGTAQSDVVGISQNTRGEVVFWTYKELYAVRSGSATRRVYLQLRDRAGNVSNLSYEPPEQDEDGDLIDDDFVLDISSSALRSISSYGQLIEFDETGQINTLLGEGDAPYFSADRIDGEFGLIETEVLNASEGHVAWGNMRWLVSAPLGSRVDFYVRTGRTRQECLDANYSDSISHIFNEYDLSAFPGQFVQVRIYMQTTSRNANPVVRQLSIESKLTSTSQLLTTVFVLPSPPRRGIVSMDKLLPVSARIIPCIDTMNSVSVADFQEVPENRLFSVDQSQYGRQLRVGFKFMTPTGVVQEMGDSIDGDTYVNMILWIQDNDSPVDDTVDFRVSFFADAERTQLVLSTTTIASPEYFILNGMPFPVSGGAFIPSNSSASVGMIPFGFNLVVGTIYYVKIDAIRTSGSQEMPELSKPFVKDASTSMYDRVAFEFVNSGDPSPFDFRIRFFEDESLTTLAASYFSLADASGWQVRPDSSSNFEDWPGSGSPFVSEGGSIDIAFSPPAGRLEINRKYYLTVESFDGVVFSMKYAGLTFVSISQSGFDCGNQSGVPILKGFSMMFELEGGELVKFNSIVS